MVGTFGEVDFIYSRYVPPGEAYFLDPGDIKKHFYRRGSWKEVILPSLGPYKRGRYTGDVSMSFQKTQARSRIYGISVTPGDYENLGA